MKKIIISVFLYVHNGKLREQIIFYIVTCMEYLILINNSNIKYRVNNSSYLVQTVKRIKTLTVQYCLQVPKQVDHGM